MSPCLAGILLTWVASGAASSAESRPNILLCISDDQSFAHTSFAGDPVVRTPAFDEIARRGVYFPLAFTAAPSCTPSRGAIVTGQAIYRLRDGGNLWSTLPADLPTYPDLLEAAGYHVGFTRKGWGPGKVEAGGRTTNPAGSRRVKTFREFLDARPDDAPFCFWFGSHDPHRGYELGSGVRSGMDPDQVAVPGCLPDLPEIRSDLCDYFLEIQRFDREVGELLALLDARGLRENTLVVITSDNGMPFPRAKANLYDLGARMPLAIAWPAGIPPGRVVEDLVGLTDLAPTFLEAAGIDVPAGMTGHSLLETLAGEGEGRVDPGRDFVVTARERHAWVREGGLGYPCRALRTHDFLYIRNYAPDRWPAGDPPLFGDVDDRAMARYTPAKELMLVHRDRPDVAPLFQAAFGKRPGEELYDLRADPDQLHNLAGEPEHASVQEQLARRLDQHLKETGDPRATDPDTPFWDQVNYVGNKTAKPRPDAPVRDR